MSAHAEPALNRSLHILLVEDHAPLREELVAQLREAGHVVTGLDSPLEVDRLVLSEPIELVVLDLNLPFEDGLSVSRRLRSALPELGIIALSGRTRTEQKAQGYADGVDIYLPKPTSIEELLAAIQSLARRLQPRQEASWLLDADGQQLVSPSGEAVTLTGREVDLVRTMAMAPDRVLDAAEIDRLLIGSRRSLESTISRLRQKLAPITGGAPCFQVLWGRGYQLLLRVRIK